jgi:ATPase subunit of ABC transporter with duplicated ATPase domains
MKAMKQELEWVRQNPKARQAKSKARLARFEEMNSASNTRSATKPRKSSFRPASAWATRSSNSRTSPRPSATACSSTT